jgi:hypothetical protein
MKTYVYSESSRSDVTDPEIADKLLEMLEKEKAGTLELRPEDWDDEYNEWLNSYIKKHGKEPENDPYANYKFNFEQLKMSQNSYGRTRRLLADVMKKGSMGDDEILVVAPLIGPEWFVKSGISLDHTFDNKRHSLKLEIKQLGLKKVPKKSAAKVAEEIESKKAELATLEAEHAAKIAADPPIAGGVRKSQRTRKLRRQRRRATRHKNI